MGRFVTLNNIFVTILNNLKIKMGISISLKIITLTKKLKMISF